MKNKTTTQKEITKKKVDFIAFIYSINELSPEIKNKICTLHLNEVKEGKDHILEVWKESMDRKWK